jgi:hypothetical protein
VATVTPAVTLPPVDVSRRKRLQIFALAAPAVSERRVRALATDFGMRGERQAGAVRLDRAAVTFREGSRSLTLFRASGGLRYSDRAVWQVDDGRSRVEFGDEEASDLAWRQVRRLGLANRRTARLLKVSRLYVGAADMTGKERSERAIDVGVAFQRLVDGVAVDGPGGKIVVYLDHRGEMTGLDRLWRDVKETHVAVEGLRPLDAIAEEVTARYRTRRNERLEVRQVRFGYVELGWRDRQRFLQPGYVVLSTLVSGDERIHRRSVFVTTAATNAVGRLEPAPRRRAPQPSRDEGASA